MLDFFQLQSMTVGMKAGFLTTQEYFQRVMSRTFDTNSGMH